MAKKTQVQLLEEIVELLTPVANMARYQIGQINQQAQEQQAYAQFQKELQEKYQADLKKVEDEG